MENKRHKHKHWNKLGGHTGAHLSSSARPRRNSKERLEGKQENVLRGHQGTKELYIWTLGKLTTKLMQEGTQVTKDTGVVEQTGVDSKNSAFRRGYKLVQLAVGDSLFVGETWQKEVHGEKKKRQTVSHAQSSTWLRAQKFAIVSRDDSKGRDHVKETAAKKMQVIP
jgi:hypothetical protein